MERELISIEAIIFSVSYAVSSLKISILKNQRAWLSNADLQKRCKSVGKVCKWRKFFFQSTINWSSDPDNQSIKKLIHSFNTYLLKMQSGQVCSWAYNDERNNWRPCFHALKEEGDNKCIK